MPPPPDLLQRGAAAIRRWRTDPVAWFRDWLDVDLEGGVWAEEGQRAYQAEILRSIVDNSMTYVVTGNGVGKDFVLGRVVPWWVHTRKGIVITTAPKDEQVRKILWGEIRAAVADARARGIEIEGNLRPADPYWTLGPKWYATGLVAREENAFQGFHAQNVLVIGDEAAGIPEFIFPAMLGCAVGDDDRVVLIGNPTCAPTHPFAKGAGTNQTPGRNVTIRIKSTETPNYRAGREVIPGLMTREGVERIYRMHGKNSAVANARVNAMFPQSGADSLIGYQHIGPARDRWASGVRGEDGDLCRAGGDVARYGEDLTAFAWCRGPEAHIDHRDIRAHLSQDEVTDFYGNRMREVGAVMISVDGGAMGPGPIDYLRRDRAIYGLHRDVRIHEVLFGAKAHDEDTYTDRRTELWFTMRDFLSERGSIDIDEDLEEELLAPTYKYVGRRYKLEPKVDTKKRLGRSPDRADALALAIGGHVGAPLSLALAGVSGANKTHPRHTAEFDREDFGVRDDFDGMGLADDSVV